MTGVQAKGRAAQNQLSSSACRHLDVGVVVAGVGSAGVDDDPAQLVGALGAGRRCLQWPILARSLGRLARIGGRLGVLVHVELQRELKPVHRAALESGWAAQQNQDDRQQPPGRAASFMHGGAAWTAS